MSVCTAPTAPPKTTFGPEVHLPLRPHFGRIESSRLHGYLGNLLPFYEQKFKQRFEELCLANKASAIHAIPHGLDFWYVFEIAQKLEIAYFLNVHDELSYNLQNRGWELQKSLEHLATVWNRADRRIVISEAMGLEYCRRYGKQPFIIITDGLTSIPVQPRKLPQCSLRVYFMGSTHLSYNSNFQSLLKALSLFQSRNPDYQVSFSYRGGIPFPLEAHGLSCTKLPWGTEKDIEKDLEQVDLLYLPLPFEQEHEPFTRYSLSTKLVTYLGSGLPILYHGPNLAAAGKLLQAHQAAISSSSLDPKLICNDLVQIKQDISATVPNALNLGKEQFWLPEIQQRFWEFQTPVLST
jgi:glycosyltransferase involved in cell wall biosynthesis